MILHFLLLFHGVLTLLSQAQEFELTSDNGSRRRKRLVWGQPVPKEDQDMYAATAYQATIVSVNYCNEGLLQILKRLSLFKPGHWDPAENWRIALEHVKNMIFTQCPIDQTRAYCGGAAITEYAIQTACHCIAKFDARNESQSIFPKVFNAWEDMVFMYVGAVKFSPQNTPYVSKSFIIHQMCQQLAGGTISHNIGIIVLRYKMAPGTKIAAPTSMVEMSKQWKYIVSKEAVCLVVGWGANNLMGKEIFGTMSFDLRKSWRVIRSYVYCYFVHRNSLDFLNYLKDGRVKYKEIQTWSCSSDFGKLTSAVGIGDAGSPLACSQGWYFGVSNWGMVAHDENLNTTFTITTDTDLVYAFYENSWDYRPSFNNYIHDLQLTDTAPTFNPNQKPTLPFYVFAQTEKSPIASRSGSQRKYVVHSSLFPLICLASFLLTVATFNFCS